MVANNGVVPIKIVRVWINDLNYTPDTAISSMETEVLGPFTVTLQNGASYVAKVTTERGNCFASTSGTLFFPMATGSPPPSTYMSSPQLGG